MDAVSQRSDGEMPFESGDYAADDQARTLRQGSLDFPDRREERHRRGFIKYQLEKGVPDVGGLGWRSRGGHLLKNQTFYAAKPGDNMWNNPTHAGPKTWKEYHGPKLRTDAQLMERMDRLEVEQAEWDAKKTFANSFRVQTLDRFYSQKVENEQKEMASQWAPHRRAKGEVHKNHETLAADLDSMPMKELKKVLTPRVLHGDRDAVRNITKRVQVEETWKQAWKQMEKARYEETRADLDHRMTYNAMLQELAGQRGRHRDPAHRMPNHCTPRLEELAKPAEVVAPDDITKRSDYAGLLHVDHRHALEARFPGQGHQFTVAFTRDASDRAAPGWPPPEPPATPEMGPSKKVSGSGVLEGSPSTSENVRKATAPVNQSRLGKVQGTFRQDPHSLAGHSTEQYLPTSAPPAPDQPELLLKEPLANDSVHMSLELPLRSDHTSYSDPDLKDTFGRPVTKADLDPPKRPVTYPVAVKTVEGQMERPNWRPKRTHGALSTETPREMNQRDSQERWPPIGSQTVDVVIGAAEGLPKTDRAGHSDPFVVCQVEGKNRSKAKTTVLNDTENPVWNQALAVRGWKRGDVLTISVYDKDMIGADDLMATVQVETEDFWPNGFHGRIEMSNTWKPEGRISENIMKYNMACRPSIEVEILARDDVNRGETNDNRSLDPQQMVSMPGAQPTLGSLCDCLDDFESKLKPVPRLGNFWMG